MFYTTIHIFPSIMTTKKNLALLLFPVLLTACTLTEVEYDEQPTDNAEERLEDILEEQPVRETNNVTYTGTIQPAGISIYQQGSHRLSLPGGKFILLESDSKDLNGYVGEDVTIFGSLRPTVEAGGMIMRVERIELIAPEEELEPEPEEDAVEELPVNEDEETTVEQVPQMEPGDEENADEEVVSELPVEESTDEEPLAEDPVVEEIGEEEGEAAATTPEYMERVEVMARQDYASVNWTQQYCSSHIGFCAPVHRNWWFKSFGTTNQKLWHVELSSEPIEAMNQGPISIDLLAGDIPVESGTIDTTNGKVSGYAQWSFGRHFVISADAALQEAVEYITNNITEYIQ